MFKINKTYLMIGGGVLLLLLLNRATKNGNGSILGNASEAITGGFVGSAADLVFGAASGVVGELSPYNNDNIFYSGANKLGSAITQSKDFNLGTWIYDKTH